MLILLQALNDDDDAGGDDLAVNVDGGKMDEFFQEVEEIRWELSFVIRPKKLPLFMKSVA